MKLLRWTRFTWNLGSLPAEPPALDERYTIRPAERDEAKVVHHAIITAFSLDTDWADALKAMRERLESDIDELLDRKEPAGLVVTHGTRVIGASVLDVQRDSENHLVSGPTVLVEYRNRCIGSALLYESLRSLRERGVEIARGVTKSNAPAAKFIYPKFGSTAEEYDYEPLVVS